MNQNSALSGWKVPFVGQRRRRNALGRDDVRNRAIIVDEPARLVRAGHHGIEVDERLVAFARRTLPGNPDRHEVEARQPAPASRPSGYIFRAFAMFTSKRSDGRMPTVSIVYMFRYGTWTR